MEDNINSDTSQIFHLWHKFKLRLLLEGILVGIFSGLFVVLYRVILGRAEQFTTTIYSFLAVNKIYIPLGLIVLIIVGYFVGFLVEKEPMISGSGIPQVEGILAGYFDVSPIKVMFNKFVGGVLAIGSGLSLGREGPSIQLGASCGQLVAKMFKRVKLEEKFLMTSGASAGLAAAFNAPFAGVMFALEEVHKNFSPLVLLSAMSASVTADYVAKQFFGLKPLFDIGGYDSIPLKYYLLLIGLGIFIGIGGAIYNSTLLKTQDLYKKIKTSTRIKMIIPFIFAMLFGLLLPQVLGGGHEIIESLIKGQVILKMAIILLLGKFVFSMISFCSGSPGGILFPLLVLGALVGAIFGNISILLFNVPSHYISNFVILAMAGMFTAIVRAPITGIILICEMSGSFTHLLSSTAVCATAYLVADLLKSSPIYESLLDRLIRKEKRGLEEETKTDKILVECIVHHGSAIEEAILKDIPFPNNTLIVSIKRGENEIIPKGDTKVIAGDFLICLVNHREEASVRKKLSLLCEEVKMK
ncbi:ClC family H(+)/Cl(-) exchange transporter [Clostridium fallax]|uniref:H+/Cl-antiporter ClcA n=1 Tax=Clostridium fallax TaxID=1533 RepID=A0A1M4VWK6_9CLOT|nr:ClC family H(+)/Cl(-) exchange transporter [Clostridium fallax]SHE73327.1 H+/Cl-antiporter ClcA [Clostridium fallax]SQB07730.1 Voltage gated chloride channel family protein [Clostridium fallax]